MNEHARQSEPLDVDDSTDTASGRTASAAGGLSSNSVPGLVRQLADDLSRLFGREVALAKSEFRQAAAELKQGVVGVSGGAGLAFAGALFLLLAVVFALARVMPDWAAAALVGLVAAIIGLIMIGSGKRKMEPANLVPERTVDSVEKDADAMKRNPS